MTQEITDGGPAFPIADSHYPNGEIQFGSNGMTLRDWFAGQALAGWLASYGDDAPHPSDRGGAAFIATGSYLLADAMITARGGAK